MTEIIPFGRIYKIFVPGMEEFCYIGSTKTELKTRFSRHRTTAPRGSPCSSAWMFQEELLPEIAELEVMENVTRENLRIREQYWFEQHPNATNHNAPQRNKHDYYMSVREKVRARQEANKEHLHAAHVAWKNANKDHLKDYTASYNSGKGKAVRAAANEAAKERVSCSICSMEMATGSLNRHLKRKHPQE